MNNCETLRDDLKAYLDGELAFARRLAVRRHLARCASCREEVTVMEKLEKELRAEKPGALEPALRARILDAVPDGPPEPAPVGPLPRSALRIRPLVAWGAAATIILVWLVLAPAFFPSREMSSVPKMAASNRSQASGSMPAEAPVEGASRIARGGDQDYFRPTRQRMEMPRSAGTGGSMGAGEPGTMPGMTGSGPVQWASPSPPAAAPKAGTYSFDSEGHAKTRGMGKMGIEASVPAPATAALPSAQRRVRKQADVTLEVQKIEEQSDAVEQMVRSSGGFVASNQLQTSDEGLKTASLTVRVPVAQFETILGRITKLGEVKAKNVTGEDITEKVSDEEQAIRVQQQEVQSLLKAETAKAEAVKNRETLQRTKVFLAQAQGRLELLKKLSALATITVTLREKPKTSIKSGGFLDEMSDTGRAAVNSFLAAARLPVLLLIWIAAYAPVWIPFAVAYRYAALAQRRRAAARETREWRARWEQEAEPEG
jgi:hypothetical protein